MSDSPPPEDPLDKAFAAYLRSCDSGDLGSREEFLSRFPELADDLKKLMEAADMIGQMTLGRPASADQPIDSSAASSDLDDLGETKALPRPSSELGAETVASFYSDGDDSNTDPAATLPMPHREKGDPGPILPFDLGDYMLLEVIGRGGMGVVYLAKQHGLDRFVAVKMIRSGMLAGEDEVRRFRIEAQAAARLHHRGIVAVYQIDRSSEGHYFFSMEHVQGTDLQRKINDAILDPKQAARYVRDVADAVAHAHERGVLHRDLKPANVLVDDKDQIHITDFGLAKHLDSDSSVTGTGTALGTPHYMAPEQAGGHSDRASRQSDIYSLGAVLFACVAGRPPIVADTVMQTLVQVIHNPAPSVRSIRPDVPIDLETIIAKCLEKNPAKRYETAEKLSSELTAFLEDRPIEARPRSRAIKAWHWMEGVPLVAAVTGRRVFHTSATHRRFQAAMLLLLLLSPILAAATIAIWQINKEAMPHRVRIAGGIEGGIYNDVSSELATRVAKAHGVNVEVVSSGGSLDNRDRLLRGVIDLAPMQATSISGDQLRVVAPLFYEVLYVLARADSNVQSIEDLRGRRVAVGPQKSGSRATAELVFQSLGLTPDLVTRVVIDWSELMNDQTPDAAMVCIGRGSPLISALLADGRWRLVAIPRGDRISLQHPTLRPLTIEPSELRFASENRGTSPVTAGVATVGTTAFLTARVDTPSELVLAALHGLYERPPLCEDLIPRHTAAEWQGLAFHQAARRYFSERHAD